MIDIKQDNDKELLTNGQWLKYKDFLMLFLVRCV